MIIDVNKKKKIESLPKEEVQDKEYHDGGFVWFGTGSEFPLVYTADMASANDQTATSNRWTLTITNSEADVSTINNPVAEWIVTYSESSESIFSAG